MSANTWTTPVVTAFDIRSRALSLAVQWYGDNGGLASHIVGIAAEFEKYLRDGAK